MHKHHTLFLQRLRSLLLCCLLGAVPPLAQGAEVYLVLGSDTAIWEGMGTSTFQDHYRSDLYTNEQRNAFKVMDPAFREKFKDSYGQTVKLTWWMMAGNIFRYADNTDVPVPNIMTLYLMKKFHGNRILQHGDELTLHYHTFVWSDYDGDGKYYWNQANNFTECRDDFDYTLAQFLLEENVFPVSFRSGWHYMDNEWQQRLDQLLPFSLHNAYPGKRTEDIEPRGNIYDWSQAPATFIPFHPSPTNYQRPGAGPGWNVRCVYMSSVSQSLMNGIFAQAAGGTSQVACLWAHLPETDFLTNISRIDQITHAVASNYPGVQFRYCTAVEAMQRWLGTQDHTPPQLQLTEELEGDQVRLLMQTDEPIFQTEPFIAVKDVFKHTQVVPCLALGSNRWSALLPGPRPHVARVAIAVTDRVGNLTTRVLEYISIPEAPSFFSAALLSSNSVRLSWTDNATNELGFAIEQASGKNGPWQQVETTPPNTSVFDLQGLSPFRTYFFRLRALGKDYHSDYSNVSGIQTPRSAPKIAAISNRTIHQGETLSLQVTAGSENPDKAHFLLTDFETDQVGDAEVLFRRPSASTTTTGFLQAGAEEDSRVTDLFPGGQNGSRVLKCHWTFAAGTTNPWLRLGTGGSHGSPSPVIDLKQTLEFDFYTETPLKLGLGLRETDTPPGTFIGSDGGLTGNVEWAGVSGKTGATPNPIRVLAAGTWHHLQFELPSETITSFTGNSVLSTPSGLGTLEHLVLVPVSAGSNVYVIYIDNVGVTFSNSLTFALEPGAPAEANIDPHTGILNWTPRESGTFLFTVRVEDNSTPPLTDYCSFSVNVLPAPVLQPIGNRTVTAGTLLRFRVMTTAAAQDTAVALTDFEDFSVGTSSVLFGRPSASSVTAPFLDISEPNYSVITDNFPSGHEGSKVMQCVWTFTNGMANPWLRLTTHNSSRLPNPVIPLNQVLRLDIFSTRELKLALGIRETTNAPESSIGSNGGITGPIEWVGVSGKSGAAPNPIRMLAAGSWQTLQFDLTAEPVCSYTGDGVLQTASGLGVLEQLAVVPLPNGSGPHTLYLDNILVVYPRNLRFGLAADAPSGASIDPITGVFDWIPTRYGTFPISVRVTTDGPPPIDESSSFNVSVLPGLNYRQAQNAVDFTWPADCILQSATNVAGPYVDEITSTNRFGCDFSGGQRFFRLRVKP